MRKFVAPVIAVCLLAGGGAWYAFSYLPAQLRAEIDATIASLSPPVTIDYGDVSIDVFNREAVFTDVTVREDQRGISSEIPRMTIARAETGEEFDALLEDVSIAFGKNPGNRFLASRVRLDGLSIDPVRDNSTTDGLAFLKRLNIRKLAVGKLRDEAEKLAVGDALLENLSAGKFSKAAITVIHSKDAAKGVEMSLAEVTAEEIDIPMIVTLPKTFRGQPDWSKLNLGKISISQLRFKHGDMLFSIKETLSDGVKSGRLVRYRVSGAKIKGTAKNGNPFEAALDRLELANFPIISVFPTNLEELRSFQTQHKNLIYDGFDIRGLKFVTEGSSFEIRHATLPKPVFRKTPSGAMYAAKAETSADFRFDLSGLVGQSAKPINPNVAKIFKDLKGRITLSGRSVADHEKKTGSVQAMKIAIPGVANLRLSGEVGNLPLRYYEAPNDPIVQQIAARQVTLGALDLALVNEGLAETLFDIAAERSGTNRAQFVQRLAHIVRATVAADGSPEGSAIADRIETFLRDPRSIRLSLKPARTLPVIALRDPRLLQSVGRLSQILGLKIQANAVPKQTRPTPDVQLKNRNRP